MKQTQKSENLFKLCTRASNFHASEWDPCLSLVSSSYNTSMLLSVRDSEYIQIISQIVLLDGRQSMRVLVYNMNITDLTLEVS